MNDDLEQKRADLRERLKKAKAGLAFVKKQEAIQKKYRADLAKGKAKLQRVAHLGKKEAAEAGSSIALAESALVTGAKSAAAARKTGLELIAALQAELDGLGQ